MNYLLRDKKRNTGKELLRIALVLCIVFLVYMFFGKQVTNILHYTQRGVGYVLGYYDDPVRPISENSLIQALKNENEQLKDMLNRKSEHDSRLLSVVLSRPPRTPFDELIIDIGADHGLSVGDLVYAEMDYIIGHVEVVHEKTATVKLFSAPGEKIDARIGSSSSPVTVEGRGGGNFYIKLPKSITVYEGDPVSVAGINPIVLGSIESIDSGEGEAFSHIYFKLPVKLNSIHYVQVKKNSN